MLLWRATVSQSKLNNGCKKKKDMAFYTGQIKTAKYYINTVLPITSGKIKAIANMDPTVVEMEDAYFGG